jgi:hypothetical protein
MVSHEKLPLGWSVQNALHELEVFEVRRASGATDKMKLAGDDSHNNLQGNGNLRLVDN